MFRRKPKVVMEVRRIEFNPGDILVLRTDQYLDQVQAQRIATNVEKSLPGLIASGHVLIMDAGMKPEVLAVPEMDPQPQTVVNLASFAAEKAAGAEGPLVRAPDGMPRYTGSGLKVRHYDEATEV